MTTYYSTSSAPSHRFKLLSAVGALDAALANPPRAFVPLVDGTVSLVDSDGDTSNGIPVTAGDRIPIGPTQFLSTGGATLTAAQILLLY